jgi:hypothetical protein
VTVSAFRRLFECNDGRDKGGGCGTGKRDRQDGRETAEAGKQLAPSLIQRYIDRRALAGRN